MFSISAITALGLLGLSITLLLDTAFFLGLVLPGDSLLFAFGILAATGDVSFWGSVAVAAVSAYIGYDIAYHLGKKFGNKVFSRHGHMIFSPKVLGYARNFYERFGVTTILFVRFVPMVRVVAGHMAGAVGMPRRTFIVYNILGSILWPLAMESLGYFFGMRVPNAEHYIAPILIGVIVVFSILPLFWKLFKRKVLHKPEEPMDIGIPEIK